MENNKTEKPITWIQQKERECIEQLRNESEQYFSLTHEIIKQRFTNEKQNNSQTMH